MTKEQILERIKELEEKIFIHEMKDHWDKHDFDLADEMELELSILKKKIGEENGNNN